MRFNPCNNLEEHQADRVSYTSRPLLCVEDMLKTTGRCCQLVFKLSVVHSGAHYAFYLFPTRLIFPCSSQRASLIRDSTCIRVMHMGRDQFLNLCMYPLWFFIYFEANWVMFLIIDKPIRQIWSSTYQHSKARTQRFTSGWVKHFHDVNETETSDQNRPGNAAHLPCCSGASSLHRPPLVDKSGNLIEAIKCWSGG